MRDLLRSPALELAPPAEIDQRVRRRGAEVRRTNKRGVTGLVVLLAAIGLALGPGLPDRFVPEDRRQPAAEAAVLGAVEPPASALLQVRYAAGAYSSTSTERAVARCTPEATLSFRDARPEHEVTVEGSRAQVAAVRACLARVPGAQVTQR